MYCGSTNKPVIIEENIGFIEKATAYFTTYDYFSAGNNLRKAIEKKLEELLPETVRISTRDLDHAMRQLFEYYDDKGCSDFISEQLRNELLQYKDIVFNPSSHFDLKSPLYKVEIEKAFEIYNILNGIPKLTIHLLAGMRASLFYTNAALNYSAEYVLRENLYAVTIPGQQVRLSDPKHRLVTYSLMGTPFLISAQTGAVKTPEQITASQNEEIKMSDRRGKIAHFINSPDPINFSNFTLADGTSLQQLIDNI